MTGPRGRKGIKNGLLTISDVAKMVGLSVSSIYSYRTWGYLPKPHSYSANRPLWTVAQIELWMRRRPHKGRPSSRPVGNTEKVS